MTLDFKIFKKLTQFSHCQKLYYIGLKKRKTLLLHNVYIMSAFIVPNILNECF